MMSLISECLATVRKEWLVSTRYPGWWIRFSVTPSLALARTVFMALSIHLTGNSVSFRELSGTDNYMGFVTIGMVLCMWAETVIWGPGWAIYEEQRSGTLSSVFITPAHRVSLMLGNLVFDCAQNLVTSVLLVVAAAIAFGFSLQVNAGQAVLAIVATALALYGFSLIFAAFVVSAKDANAVSGLMGTAFMVFSGTTYPISALPVWLRPLTYISPLTWGIDACRQALLTGQPWLTSATGYWLLGYAGVLPVLGWILFTRCVSRSRKNGDFGLF
jgi:ABC-2 type transport system permease protein